MNEPPPRMYTQKKRIVIIEHMIQCVLLIACVLRKFVFLMEDIDKLPSFVLHPSPQKRENRGKRFQCTLISYRNAKKLVGISWSKLLKCTRPWRTNVGSWLSE